MPNKAIEACAAIKAAWEAVQAIVGPVSITADRDKIEVHVIGLRQLEQIPGKLEFKQLLYCEEYSHEVYKMLDGVSFFCLLRQEQYEALQESA